jgi:uncharacterized protein
MPVVYFKAIDSYSRTDEISAAAADLLRLLVEREKVPLYPFIPLKVHVGEKGNQTFIEPKNFNGIIDYLQEQGIKSAYVETNVLYKGERNTRDKHLKVAAQHGFTRIPVIIGDGERGEDYALVTVDKKHYQACKIAGAIAREKQIIVLSHFKGHTLSGFGGAIKQLAMGCSSKGGKLDQHANNIPVVKGSLCTACGACARHCPTDAITVEKKAVIDRSTCIGCASCMGVCPPGAIRNRWMVTPRVFSERMAEYALAAAKGKEHIYISFAMNITRGCDCIGKSMKPIVGDIGIFASTDPVAIDQACLDVLNRNRLIKHLTRGRHGLKYAESIGLGSRKYRLVSV